MTPERQEALALRLWLHTWPIIALAILFAWPPTRPQWLLIAFLTLILLWPATLMVGRIWGVRAGVLASSVFALLLAGRPLMGPPEIQLQPQQIERPFSAPYQMARQALRPRLTARTWQNLAERNPAPIAYLYLEVATAVGVRDPALAVSIDERPLGRLDETTVVGSAGTWHGSDGEERQGLWHHLVVDQRVLRSDSEFVVTVGPARDAPSSPGGVSLVGGYRSPQANSTETSFFDGLSWRTDRDVVLPGFPLQVSGEARYYIEVRIVDPDTRRLLVNIY